jgi:hypothetical protein
LSDNADQNKKNEQFRSQLRTFKRHMGFRNKRTFQTVLRAAGETETTQENIQDWLELDEGDSRFQLLVFLWFLNIGFTVIFLIYFQQNYLYY